MYYFTNYLLPVLVLIIPYDVSAFHSPLHQSSFQLANGRGKREFGILKIRNNHESSLFMAADPTDLVGSILSFNNLPVLIAPLAAFAAGVSALNERKRIEEEIATTESELEAIKQRLKTSELQINVRELINF